MTDDTIERGFAADILAVAQIKAVPTILDLICRITGMGFAAVARVTEGRWIACGVRDLIDFGLLPGGELKVETTICLEVRESSEPVIINHVAEDPTYCRHPTPAMYGFQSYISMPIILADGTFFGTLCAIDPHPAKLDTPDIIDMFRLFAELIATHLDNIQRAAASEAALYDEREIASLREQFIAVLGHDLRNPLTSIDAGTRMLQSTPLSEKALRITGLMRKSVARMSELIDDVLDFARGRLGDGLTLERRTPAPIEPLLRQVIAEFEASFPSRSFDIHIAVNSLIVSDQRRIGQLFSNLLGNALAYGREDKPIQVAATMQGQTFELSVANAGEPMPAETMKRIFLPFTRGSFRDNQQGLGLGLYICAEIAKAHGGFLTASSNAEVTRFVFRMPIAGAD